MGDHDLRVAGADGRGRSARRFLEAVEEVCGALGAPLPPIGEVTDTGELRAFHDGERSARSPRAFLTDEAPRYRVEPAPRAAAPEPPAARRAAARRTARAARLAEHPLARVDLRALRPPRRLAHRPPARPRRGRAAAATLAARARGLARRAGPGRRARRRAPAARWRCSRRRGTSPAPAASRSGSPTASTSATRRSPRSPGSSPRRSRGWRGPPRRCGIPVVSGNVSLYNETDGRAIPPTPVVGCVGLVPDVRTRPGPLARGRRRARSPARPSCRSRAPSTRRSTASRAGHAATSTSPPRRAGRVPLARGAAARRSRTTSPTAASAVALAEAALWSGVGAELDLPDDCSPGSARAAARR